MTAALSGPMLPPRAGGTPGQAMVLLHGYGADGQDLISLGHEWGRLFPGMMFVSPNAPAPSGAGQGYEWFPIDYERRAETWRNGPRLAAPVLVNFLIDLWAQTGVAPAQTVLAGFSQGAMMALHVGTALDRQLAGIIAFSGAFSPADGFGSGRFARPPVALVHGVDDMVVEAEHSRAAREALAAAGFDVSLHLSPGTGHGIAPDGLEFATAFLARQLGNSR